MTTTTTERQYRALRNLKNGWGQDLPLIAHLDDGRIEFEVDRTGGGTFGGYIDQGGGIHWDNRDDVVYLNDQSPYAPRVPARPSR